MRSVRYQFKPPSDVFHWNRRDLESLSRAIAGGNVVGYIGAGPSIDAGLPDWREMSLRLLDWVISKGALKNRQFLRDLIHERKFPILCQLLEDHLESNLKLHDRIKELCDPPGSKPSRAHVAIATLPIPLMVTTNFDKLLEKAFESLPQAYQDGREILTWQNAGKIMPLVRSGASGIIKVHGDIDTPQSLVLTRSKYRHLANEPSVRSVLKTLISAKSFLFIGCSLTDPDILAVMDEMLEESRILERSPDAGDPAAERILHYAILPEKEAPSAFVKHLRKDYGIATFPLRAVDDLTAALRLMSASVSRLMAGRMAAKLPSESLPVARGSTFSTLSTIQKLLPEIVRYSGSHRADVALATGDRTHALDCRIKCDAGAGSSNASTDSDRPGPRSVMQSVFMLPVDSLWVRDTRNVEAAEEDATVPYEVADDAVQSQLAVPIIAEGRRIGVLSVESYLKDAYREGHLEFLRRCATYIAALQSEAEGRKGRVQALHLRGGTPAENARVSKNVLRYLRRLYEGSSSLRGLLYVADYVTGRLTAVDPASKEPEGGEISYAFDAKRGFAPHVFREREACYAPNVRKAIQQGLVDGNYAQLVGLSNGPIFGTPVYDRGLMCAVLVLWSAHSGRSAPDAGLADPGQRSLLAAAANLVVAALPDASRRNRLDRLIESLHRIEGASGPDVYRSALHAIQQAGLRRARVWLRETSYFECAYIEPPDHSVVRETWKKDAAYYSDYCEFIVRSYRTDPWARVQGPSYFKGVSDPHAGAHKKDPAGDWIVAPLVTWNAEVCAQELLGYLAADNHPESIHFQDESETNWILLQMSVIAVITARAMSKERTRAAAAG
jgi:hypothetical protein